MKKKFLDELYLSTIDEVLSGIPYSYQREVKRNYKNNLKDKYEDLDIDNNVFKLKLDKFTKLELSYWKSLTIDMKLSFLVSDKNFEEVVFISLIGLNVALMKDSDAVIFDKNLAISYIKRMDELLRGVKFFNKEMAKKYFYDGILDFEFASGINNEKTYRLYNGKTL